MEWQGNEEIKTCLCSERSRAVVLDKNLKVKC
jgi:hypothetical protein